ncbi:hypothetical protein CGI23_24555 [Vibrio parahaemolyticus]|nr:hypothetical protein CGI23_24555 [Vibrio parahaemolyticus]
MSFFEKAHNAALSGEQRRPPHLNHCDVNTKAESNRKCRALGIRLKRFVSKQTQRLMHNSITTQSIPAPKPFGMVLVTVKSRFS